MKTISRVEAEGVVSRSYRVVAELAGGGSALVCLATSWRHAVKSVHRLSGALPAGTSRLVLERWSGTPFSGRWIVLAAGLTLSVTSGLRTVLSSGRGPSR